MSKVVKVLGTLLALGLSLGLMSCSKKSSGGDGHPGGGPTLSLVGTCKASGYPVDLCISEERAYVVGTSVFDSSAVFALVMDIVDVSKSSEPRLLSTYLDSNMYSGAAVAVRNERAYVVNLGGGIVVVNCSDPAHPTRMSSYSAPSFSFGVDICIEGSRAFVANSNGVRIFDLSNADTVSQTARCNTPGFACGVAVANGFAYVAGGYGGLQVISLSDPSNPEIVGTCSAPDAAMRIAVNGHYAYVACRDSGLQIFDVANPSQPVNVGHINISGWAVDVVVEGDYAFVAAQWGGLQVVKVSDPANAKLVSTYLGSGSATSATTGVFKSGKYIYIADFWGGLKILEFTP